MTSAPKLNRELATQLADLPHSYTTSEDLPHRSCVVCGSTADEPRHETATRELAAATTMQREKGTDDAA